MYKAYEIDYNNRCYLVGEAETLKDARAIARKALRKSHGEFPTFIRTDKAFVENVPYNHK